MRLSGSIVAIITPFFKGKIDEGAFKRLIEWHIHNGTSGLVIAGTTGESALLSDEEWETLLRLAVEVGTGRLALIAGCGFPSTEKTVDYVEKAKALGADAALIVTPYYIKPTPEGMIAHITAITSACDLPILLYNNPGRVGVDLSIDTVLKLSQIPGVVGIKDCHTDHLTRLAAFKQHAPKEFMVFSGDDPTAQTFLAHGGDGVISATGNVAPKEMAALCATPLAGEPETLTQLHRILGQEPNPIPVKYAVSALGFCAPEIRLPLTLPSSALQTTIQSMVSQLPGADDLTL